MLNRYHVAFDIGNVISQFRWQTFTDELINQNVVQKNGALDFIKTIQPFNDLGLLTIESALRDRFGCYNSKRIGWALEAWNATLTINPIMVELIKELKSKKRKVAFLSNMGMDHAQFLRNNSSLFEDCDLHLSYQVGSRKPQKLFFQSFLMQNPEYKGCLFIDDIAENIQTAEELDFLGFHFDLDKQIEQNSLAETVNEIRSKIIF